MSVDDKFHWFTYNNNNKQSDKRWLRKINRSLAFPRFSHFFPFLLYIVFIFAMLIITLRTLTLHKTGFYDEVEQKHRRYESPRQLSSDFIKHLGTNRSAETNLIVNALKSADFNNDDVLTTKELADYISKNIAKHIRNAKQSNRKAFETIDTDPQDGFLTWTEYHTYFLRKHGYKDEYINNHNEKKHSLLSRKQKEAIMRDKALWLEAAKYDNDVVTLSEKEFLLFKHPEASDLRLSDTVDDLMKQLDLDGNDFLSVEEFIEALPSDANLMPRLAKASVKERKEEFEKFIDVNGNGHASRDELLQYIDPRNYRHANQEANNLFMVADTNHDNILTIQEMLSKSEIFVASKMISAFDSLHDEF